MPNRPPTVFKSFQTRLALFFTALFAAVLGIAFIATQNAIVRNIFDQSRMQLEASYQSFERRFAANADSLADGSRILASDYGFRQAMATDDRATILSALHNLGARIRADRVMLVSLENRILSDTGTAADAAATGNIVSLGTSDATFPFPDMIDAADVDGQATAITVLDERIYQTVVVPILAPVPIAWIVICVEIGDAFAVEMHWQSALPLDITFGYRTADGGWRPGASTLPPDQLAVLRPIMAQTANGAMEAPIMLEMSGVEYATLIAPLPVPEAGPPVSAAMQYSLDLALESYRPLFVLLIGLAAGALGLCLIGALAISRSLSKPIRELDEAAKRIQAGRYDEKVEVEQQDEIGRLSETFNQMMSGIAQREEKIAHQARHDSLTGLPNRLAFEGHISDLIIARQSQDPKRGFSVLLLQIGRFSEINNTLGHDTGELLIRMIGRSLQRLVPHPNAVARHAGNMFALVLDMDDPVEVARMVDRVLGLFEDPMAIAGLNIDVTASIGEARYPQHGGSARALMQHADTAIYEAKQAGSAYAAYDPDIDPYKPERLSMMGELRQGLDKGQFKFHFQPKIDIATDTMTAVEALIRWNHPERGFMSPDQFIPLAEQTGNIHKLTAWGLEAAVRQIRAWADMGINLKIAVNLSARDLSNRRLPEQIGQLAALHRVQPDRLILEITESAVMADTANVLEVLTKLHGMGLTLSIDDYGTGYSSMAYFNRLPVQELKIDKSFVLKMAANRPDEILVRSTIDLGHNLGLKVTAEGVEDETTMEMLRAYGCETAQGYFISKPLPAEEIEKFYATSRWSPLRRDGRETAVAAGA